VDSDFSRQNSVGTGGYGGYRLHQLQDAFGIVEDHDSATEFSDNVSVLTLWTEGNVPGSTSERGDELIGGRGGEAGWIILPHPDAIGTEI